MTEVNGTYNICSFLLCGFASFTKKERWNGKIETFVMYRKSKYWYIGLWHGNMSTGIGYPSTTFFRIMSSVDTELPPGNGWTTVGRGVIPAPNLTCLLQ